MEAWGQGSGDAGTRRQGEKKTGDKETRRQGEKGTRGPGDKGEDRKQGSEGLGSEPI